MSSGAPTLWPAEALWEALAPVLPGFTVEILPQLDSSNSELMRRAHAGQLEPTLLVVERQTAGRGRLGRTWADAGPAASLCFSLGLPLQPRDWSGLSLAVGLALVHSLHPQIQLKWPNDLWWHHRKLGGILIETVRIGEIRYAVIGVGLNLQLPHVPDLRTPAAALCELLPGVEAGALLGQLLPPLVQQVLRFEDEGFAPLRPAFHTRDLLYGQEVSASDGTVGLARGVDANGALLVHTAAGLKKISSAEVSVRPQSPSGAAPAPL